MKDFNDKVAVITGAAAGIGRAIAERCAKEGMKVVLADVEAPALAQAENEMKAAGANVLAVVTDVSKASDVEALAAKTLDAFGAVHLVFNNAGVGIVPPRCLWENTLADWEWILGVNLWGVIHGVRTFVPIMLGQDTEGHVVNTASIAGLSSIPYNGTYGLTKHAVVALTESLYYELDLRNAKLKTSVLCPGFVRTNIMDGDRNRPAELPNVPPEQTSAPATMEVAYRQAVEEGMSPAEVADQVFDALRNERLYILTTHDYDDLIRLRTEDIVTQTNPVLNPELAQALGVAPGEAAAEGTTAG